MAFRFTPETPRIEPNAARARLLPFLPRRLRAVLDERMRVPAARIGLAAEITALVPEASVLCEAWTAAIAAAGSSLWHDPTMAGATAGLVAYLDAHAAEFDRPAAQALADVAVLLARGADDRTATARLALPLWSEASALPDLALEIRSIATAQADLVLGAIVDDEDDVADPEAADRQREAHAALCEAWTVALEDALLALRAEAGAAAAAAAILSTGGGDDYIDGLLMIQALTAFGERVTWPAVERVRATAREASRTLDLALRKVQAQMRERTAAAPTRAATISSVPQPKSLVVPDGHILVVPGIQETGFDRGKAAGRGFENVIGKPLPLVSVPDLTVVRATLIAEYPYAIQSVDRLLSELIGQRYPVLRPTVLVGPPGCGKSRLIGRLADCLGLGLWRVDATHDVGSAIGGLGRRWANTEPCHAIMAISRYGIANPVMMVDEIEKASTRSDYGRLWDAMLPLLEPETAGHYPDPAFQTEVDLSHVSWLATANSVDALPRPLLDRLRVIEVPAPGPDDFDALIAPLLIRIAVSRGLDARFLPALDSLERDVVHRAWRGGSVRRLTRLVEAIVNAREMHSPRH